MLVDGIGFRLSGGGGVALLGDDADGTLTLAVVLLAIVPVASPGL